VFIKNNLFAFFRLTTIVITMLAALLFSELSFAGAGFAEQGNALSKALYEELVKKRVCSDLKECHQSIQLYREDGKRIFLNLYGQKDTKLASKIVAFYIEKGLKITGGMPITFKVFPGPKTQYLGFFRGMFSNDGETLRLELNN
jgi:hypothetical protein